VVRAKLEYGNLATDWTPAPEDITNSLEVFKTETHQSFAVLDGKIEGKVSQTDFNALGQTVSNQATLISQNAGAIELRATKQEFSELNNTVGVLTGRIGSAETAIQQNSNAISLRAVKSDVDTQINYVNGRVDSTVTRLDAAELKITPEAIKSTVKGQTDDIVNAAVSNINIGGRNLILGSSFKIDVSISKVDYILAYYDFSSSLVNDVVYILSFKIKTFQGKTARIWFRTNMDRPSSFDDTVEFNSEDKNQIKTYSAIFNTTQSDTNIVFYNFGYGSTEVQRLGNAFIIYDLKLEKGNKETDWTPAPEDVSNSIDDLKNRVSINETAITQTKEEINLRATKTEVTTQVNQAKTDASNDATNKANNAISTSKTYTDSQITIANNAISLKADKSDVEGLTTRIESAELKITPEAINSTVSGQINSKINDIVEIKDTRNDNRPPSWYYANYPFRTVREFKNISTVGLPDLGEYYAQVTTNVPWDHVSGGNIIQEAVQLGRTYTRFGLTDGWTAWVEKETTTGAQDKANDAYNNAVGYTDSQITQTKSEINLSVDARINNINNEIGGLQNRVSSAELKLTDDSIRAVVKSQTENIVNDTVLANLWSSGKPLNPDPTFKEGMNGLQVYNNTGAGATAWSRLEKSSFNEIFPTTSGYGIYFMQNGDRPTQPGWGGFHFSTQTRPKAKFIVRMLLAFEEGRYIEFRTNAFGDNGSQRWLTPVVGKGINNFAEYISYVECGATGNFSTTNFFAFYGDTSVSVRIAFAGVYDITDAVNNYTTKEEIASSFEMTPGGITLAGKTISLAGMVTFSSLDADSQSRVNTANSTASNAQSIANSAKNTADSASSVAATASDKADNATTTAQNASNTAGSALNKATETEQSLITLQASLKGMAFEDKVELAKMGTTIINGGYLKTELLNVNEIFAQNIIATGQITATNLLVTGNSQVAGFKISGNQLENNAVDAALIFDELGGDGFLRINGDADSILSIRTDTANRRGISIATYAAGAIGLNIVNNASSGTGFAVRALGSSQFYVRSGETWNAPGVLGAALVDLSNAATSHFWSIAGLGSYFYKANTLTLRWNHNLGHTEYVIIATLVNPNVANIVAPQKYDDYMTITYNLIQPGASPLLNLMLIGRNKLT